MDISCAIMDVIEARDEFIKKRLLAEGVSSKTINIVFDKSAVADDDAGSAEEPSDPVPTKRFLKSNSSATGDSVASTSSSMSSTSSRTLSKPTQKFNTPQYEVKDKYPQDYSDGSVVLVLNYGKLSHALFGDFQKYHSKFRAFLTGNPICSYNPNLTFGPGWIIKDKTRVGEIKKSLISQGVKYREIEMVEYQKEVQKGGKPPDALKNSSTSAKETTSSSSGSSDGIVTSKIEPAKITPKSLPKVTAPKVAAKVAAKATLIPKCASSKIPEKGSGKILKNACGNYEEEGTGYVFMKLPVGKGGKDVKVCIGYQNPLLVEKGLASVSKLDTELQKDCSSRGHTVLTETMVSLIRSKNVSLADEIHEMWIREGDDESADAADTVEDTVSGSESE